MSAWVPIAISFGILMLALALALARAAKRADEAMGIDDEWAGHKP